MGHALIRTSAKGKGCKFIGTCTKCGKENLPMTAVHESCPQDEIVSDAAALVQILRPH